ncbi:MAG: tyrosine-type recombinase/integrase, partial [Acidobacteria bacterium]|nr:tyrosine-type recombinase/integrase [Acidobacteriota bacterium]
EKKAQTAPTMANRLLALISRMFNFALERDWVTTNPAQRITKPGAETSRDRVLTDDEIRTVWTLLEAEADDDPIINRRVAAAFTLRLMTAQRGAEVIRMRWADLDLEAGWWTIPPEMTKNGEQHRVPLSKPAVALLTTLRAAAAPAAIYVFPALRRPKDKAERPAVDLHKKMGVALTSALGGTIRPHDLRRTAATRMAAAGVARISISYLLNHVDGGPRSTLVYDRFERDPEKRTAMETWARSLTAILTAKPATGKVLPMRGAR